MHILFWETCKLLLSYPIHILSILGTIFPFLFPPLCFFFDLIRLLGYVLLLFSFISHYRGIGHDPLFYFTYFHFITYLFSLLIFSFFTLQPSFLQHFHYLYIFIFYLPFTFIPSGVFFSFCCFDFSNFSSYASYAYIDIYFYSCITPLIQYGILNM